MPASATRVVLITGCSDGGIGWGLAKEFEKTGRYRVFATARNVDKMSTLPASIERLQLDITSQESVNEAIDTVIREAGRIDVLINNAGLDTAPLPLVEAPIDQIQIMYETNVVSMIRVTQAASKHMIKQARDEPRKAGMIVNLGSVAGYVAFPFGAVYNSTKAAIHSLSDALRNELAPFGIKVIVLAPGIVKTNFMDKSQAFTKLAPDSNYHAMAGNVQFRFETFDKSYMPLDNFAVKTVRFLEKQGAGGSSKLATTPHYSLGGLAGTSVFLGKLPYRLQDLLIRMTFKMPNSIAQLQRLEKKQ